MQKYYTINSYICLNVNGADVGLLNIQWKIQQQKIKKQKNTCAFQICIPVISDHLDQFSEFYFNLFMYSFI